MLRSRLSLGFFLLVTLIFPDSSPFGILSLPEDTSEESITVTVPSVQTDVVSATPSPEDTLDSPDFVYTGCGKRSFSHKLSDRIKGGYDAEQIKWPWHAQMNQLLAGPNNTLLLKVPDSCGASLINKNWALTAAHCVHRTKRKKWGRNIEEQFYLTFGDRKSPNDTVVRSAKQIFVHPYYEYEISQAKFDLALVLLNETVKFTRTVLPICLPEVDLDLTGHSTFLTGRGIVVKKEVDLDMEYKFGTLTNVIGQYFSLDEDSWRRKFTSLVLDGNVSSFRSLQHVKMQIMHNSECLEMSEDESCPHCQRLLKTSDSMLCAGLPDGSVSATHGDSGGPLVIKLYDGTWTQVGVVSTGHPEYKFGIFTNVAKHLWWINKVVKAHSPPEDFDDDGY